MAIHNWPTSSILLNVIQTHLTSIIPGQLGGMQWYSRVWFDRKQNANHEQVLSQCFVLCRAKADDNQYLQCIEKREIYGYDRKIDTRLSHFLSRNRRPGHGCSVDQKIVEMTNTWWDEKIFIWCDIIAIASIYYNNSCSSWSCKLHVERRDEVTNVHLVRYDRRPNLLKTAKPGRYSRSQQGHKVD